MANIRKEGILAKAMVFLVLRIFLIEAAPSLKLKTWNEGELSPIISPPCTTNELCWSWLPVIDAPGSPYIFQENPEMQAPRIQTIRGADATLIPWGNTPEKTEIAERISIPISQLPGKLTKKDVFMSRGWGAGGMPFSVLYMSPHNSRNTHSPSQSSIPREAQKSESAIRTSEVIPIPSKSIQQNYRVMLRNGSSGQPRRQYSIIPQLFISYGWGPSGK